MKKCGTIETIPALRRGELCSPASIDPPAYCHSERSEESHTFRTVELCSSAKKSLIFKDVKRQIPIDKGENA